MSDVTTISNDRGNILQTSCKTSLKEKNKTKQKPEYCCVVTRCMDRNSRDVSGGTEAMLSFFGCSKFSVRVYNASDVPTTQTFAINW